MLFDMFKNASRLFLLLFLMISMFSCQKDETMHGKVEILFQNSNISKDTSLQIGEAINFSVVASSENSNITFLGVRLNHATVLDSGLNSSILIYKYSAIKSNLSNERWTFIVMNKNREKDSIVINIAKKESSNFNPINIYDNITLGAQNNCCYNGFFATSDGSILNYEQSLQNISKIDIIYCYYQDVQSTLSSPNETDISIIYSGIATWAVKNETRYNLTSLSTADFDNANNDSLLITNYDVINAKRKAKNIQNNQVWAFKIQKGKFGLVKINNVETDVVGKINVSIKIQQ